MVKVRGWKLLKLTTNSQKCKHLDYVEQEKRIQARPAKKKMMILRKVIKKKLNIQIDFAKPLERKYN